MSISKITKGTYILNNSGDRVTLVEAADPLQGTCLKLTGDTVYRSVPVTADSWNTFMPILGNWLFSTEGTVETVSNIGWVCPVNKSILIHIPAGKTTLYYSGSADFGYLIELA